MRAYAKRTFLITRSLIRSPRATTKLMLNRLHRDYSHTKAWRGAVGLLNRWRNRSLPSEARAIMESGLFDAAYFARRDQTFSTSSGIARYLEVGVSQNVNPNPLFDVDFYYIRHLAKLDEPAEPLTHFIEKGALEGNATSRLFDTRYYVETYPEVALSGMNPLRHYLEQGRVAGLIPFNAEGLNLHPTSVQLHQLDLSSPEAHAFDHVIYAQFNPDLDASVSFDHSRLLEHYEKLGRAEGRIATKAGLLAFLGAPPAAVPLNFNDNEYFELNQDLTEHIDHTYYSALSHYLVHAHRDHRKYAYSDYYLRTIGEDLHKIVRQETPPDGSLPRVCILVHVYYEDVWDEIAQHLVVLDQKSYDILVNIVDTIWTHELHERIRALLPHARIVVSPNRGRDIGGHLNSLREVNFDDYFAFVLIHTKKSQHLDPYLAANWRRSLIEPLIGSPDILADNIALLQSNGEFGIVGAAAWRHYGVDQNAEHFLYLLDKFEIPEEVRNCEFVSGTMMIVRSNILKRMYTVLATETFALADGKDVEWLRDGQLEHAAERLFGNVCAAMKYTIAWK